MLKQSLLFSLLVVLLLGGAVVGERTLSPAFQKCISGQPNSNNDTTAEKNPPVLVVELGLYAQCSGAFVDQHGSGITALATIVIAAFTGTLWRATSTQALLTKEALITDKRPFVFARDIMHYWEFNPISKQYSWRFRPVWENTGSTPTRNARIYTDCELRSTRIEKGFDFTKIRYPNGRGHFGPKYSAPGGLAPQPPTAAISPQDIIDIQEGRKFLYFWGWIKYFDVFPGTPEHITRFCWQITPVGDPFAYVPAKTTNDRESLNFPCIRHDEGSCADDECSA